MKKVVAKKWTFFCDFKPGGLSAVFVVSLPLLLGDQLTDVLSKAARQGASAIEGLANSVLMFLGIG